MVSPEDLLDRVTDRDSFIAFVEALAAERIEAERIEHADPQMYRIDGACNWKNTDIASFLYAALDYFQAKPLHIPDATPSWRTFAEILWCGKIIE